MIDGDGEIGKDTHEYGRVITNIAVSQICEGVGFDHCRDSALGLLTEIVIHYLRDFGETAHFYANLSGRTECNVVDVIQSLEDLVLGKLFSSSWEVNSWVKGLNTAAQEIKKYVRLKEEVPFARDVTQFPVVKTQKPKTLSFLQIGEKPDLKHIPDWLPAFPDHHTYLMTPIWNERTRDPHKDKMEQARQRSKAELSFFNLQQRLACSGTSTSSPSVTILNASDNGKVKVTAEKSSQFLASNGGSGKQDVLLLEEEDAAPGIPSAQLLNELLVINGSSVLEIFSHTIRKANIAGGDDRKVFTRKRPIVNFQLGVNKKYLGMPLDLILQKKIAREEAHLVGRADDDKKRRAEHILKYSMENLQELVQL